MTMSLKIEADSFDGLIAELQTLHRELLGAPTAAAIERAEPLPSRGGTAEDVMERKVSMVWNRASTRVRRVLIAIAELQEMGSDTSVAAVYDHLDGDEPKESSVTGLMAKVTRRLQGIDETAPEHPMVINERGVNGRVAYQFAPEACAAILRRKNP